VVEDGPGKFLAEQQAGLQHLTKILQKDPNVAICGVGEYVEGDCASMMWLLFFSCLYTMA
jgi:hypothetical protein